MKAAEATASSELESLRQRLSEATSAESAAADSTAAAAAAAAAEAGVELARLNNEIEGMRKEALASQDAHAREMREAEERLAEIERQVRAAVLCVSRVVEHYFAMNNATTSETLCLILCEKLGFVIPLWAATSHCKGFLKWFSQKRANGVC